MKVVLFCGGLGTRLREYSDVLPKPMVPIGNRPILWHLMRYYAHYGHKDFVLCLGYRADAIKDYFLNYNECASNDFTLSLADKNIDFASRDVVDWRITFADTGVQTSIGQRLKAVRPYLEGEECFLANYGDNVSDAPLPRMIDHFHLHKPVGLFLSVRPTQSFHVVQTKSDGRVTFIEDIGRSDVWINAGYFVFRREVFDYMHEGDELVGPTFQRMIRDDALMAYKYEGFWACMDTFKDKQRLDDMLARGEALWKVWKPPPCRSERSHGPC